MKNLMNLKITTAVKVILILEANIVSKAAYAFLMDIWSAVPLLRVTNLAIKV